jgi:hypothetical protein
MGERVLLPGAFAPGGAPLIASPFQFAVGGEDNLRIRMWFKNYAGTGVLNDCVLVSFRSVGRTGAIQLTQQFLTPTDDRIATPAFITLAPGFVQDLTVTWAGPSTFTGLCYIAVDLVRGAASSNAVIAGQLIGGYIRPGGGLAWPGSPITQSIEGPGFPRNVQTTSLPVGADVSITQPLLTRWRWIAAFAQILTSGAAGNRFPALVFKDPGLTIQLRIGPSGTVPTGALGFMNWLGGASQAPIAGGTFMVVPFPQRLITPGGWTLATLTGALDGADQYQAFGVFVDEYLEANV